jgi:hypothetical protein
MSIQILLEPQSINNKSLGVYSTSLNTIDLNVEAVNNQILNYRTPNLGLLGDVLATDGIGSVYWTSNPAPPSSGILYNGVLPATTNRLLKVSNPAGNTADESDILETPTELNLTTNKPFKTVKTIFTDNQEFVSKLYVDSLPVVDITTLNDASGVLNSIISSNVSPNFLLKGLSSSTGITLAPIGNDIQITNNSPATLINVNNVGTNSLISSNSNPTFNLKGLSASTGITLAAVGNDIEITNNLPSSLITLNNVGTNSLISSNSNPTFNLKGLVAGSNISISSTGTDLTINSTGGGGGGGSGDGLRFNPLINNTVQLPGGPKSYFYQLIIDEKTSINGFSVFMNAGGDPLRVAIYRNFVKGVPLNNATLCGQSLSVIGTAGLPYTRAPISAVIGQNLNFLAGEYMVIGFSSSGISNTYLGSTIMVGNNDLAFISSSNYVASGFPSVISTSTIFNTLANKICFTLY